MNLTKEADLNRKKITIKQLRLDIKKFVKARNWEQFHSPKNLSMSIAIEAAELMEHFQWTNTVEETVNVLKNKHKRSEVEDEIADIAIYLMDFCNLYGVNLEQAVFKKMKKNGKKYPAKIAKGRIEKYTFYGKNVKK